MNASHIGEQLELFGPEEMRRIVVRVPWQGRSPRSLTRVAESLIFQSREKKCMSELISPLQYELWPINRAPRQSLGAPSLLPLDLEVYDGERT